MGTEDSKNSLISIYDELLDAIKNKSFIRFEDSIIIGRCLRNRLKCEDEKGLLAVHGKYNKNVINDDEHRMAMQIMDKIYCYFAYSFNFGFTFNLDEIQQLNATKNNLDDDILSKKQEILKTSHGKKIYNVIRDRKTKFVTSSNIEKEEKKQKGKEINIKIFHNIKNKMQQFLISLKTPQTMSHKDTIKFIKTLQVRSKREQRFSALKGLSSDQWKALILM